MIPVTVRLKFATTPQRPVAAWLVRGSAAEDWLRAAAHCPGDPEAVRILPLGEDEFAATPTAALLVWEDQHVPPSPTAGFGGGACPPGVHGYGFAAARVLAPVEAVIEPPLTAEEWERALPETDALFVWHPSLGFVRFDPADRLTIADLLAAPSESPADWTEARTAPAYVDRLWSVVSVEPLPTMAEVEAEWREELGSRRPLDALPKSPGETSLTWKERLAAATANFRAAWRRWFGKRAADQPSPGRPWLGSELGGVLWTAALVLFLLLLMQWIDPLAVLLILGLLWLLFQGLRGLGGSGSETEPPSRRSIAARSIGTGPYRLGKWLKSQWERFVQWRTGQHASGSWMQRADQSLRRREIDRLLHMLEQNPAEGLRYAIPFGGDPGRGTGAAGNELVRRDWNFGLLGGGGGGPADFWNIDPMQQIKLQQRYRELAEREQLAGRHRRAAYIYSQLLGDWNASATALKSGQYFAEAAVIYHDRLHNMPQAAVCYDLAGQPDEALRIYRDQKLWTAAGDLCEKLGRSEEAKSCYHAAVQHWLSAGDVRSAADVLETKLHDVDGALAELKRTWPGHHNADSYFDLWFTVAARHHRHAQAGQRIEKLTGGNTDASTLKLLPRLQAVRIAYPEANVQHLAKERTLQLVSQHLSNATPAESRQLAAFLPGLSPQDRLLPRDCQRYVDRRLAEPLTPARKLPTKPQLRLERRFPKEQGELGRDFPADWHFDPPGQITVPAFVAEHWLAVKPMPSGLTHVLWIDDIGAAWLTAYTAEGATAKSQRFAEEWLIDPATVTVLLRGRSAIWPVGDDNILAVLPIGDDELVGECIDAEGIRVWSGVIEGRYLIGQAVHGSTQILVVREDGVSLWEDIRRPGDGIVAFSGWTHPKATFLPGGLAAIVDDQTLTVLNVADGKSVMNANHAATFPVAVEPAGIGRFSVLRDEGEVEVWAW